jgi:predicted  nucleic acid-binding Zn-ribbon protein
MMMRALLVAIALVSSAPTSAQSADVQILNIERDRIRRQVATLLAEIERLDVSLRQIRSRMAEHNARATSLREARTRINGELPSIRQAYWRVCTGRGSVFPPGRCVFRPADQASVQQILDRLEDQQRRFQDVVEQLSSLGSAGRVINAELDRLEARRPQILDELTSLRDRLIVVSNRIEQFESRSRTATIEIETRILSPDPQAGMKSLQTITVNFSDQTVTNTYETGRTHIGPVSLPSIRNNFRVVNQRVNSDSAQFGARGATASGVAVLPEINYGFDFSISREGSVVLTGGCHDAYPAYIIRVNGRELYRFNHQRLDLLQLAGICDVLTGSRTISGWVRP